MKKHSLNIIGAGKLGKTIGKLFKINNCFEIKGIVNSDRQGAQEAVAFIGEGEAYDTVHDLPVADVCMISTPDAHIETLAEALSKNPWIEKTKVVFHCSGIQPSSILSVLSHKKISIGSMHPVMTFAEPEKTVHNFSGAYCGFEGDAAAFELLHPAFSSIGGTVFKINPNKKDVYHAAAVVACSYLVSLMDIALELYTASGLAPNEARAMMQPLVEQTLNNFFSDLSDQSLTGPIARGDDEVVQKHMDAIKDEKIKKVYAAIGMRALEISARSGGVSEERLGRIKNILEPP